MATNNTLATTGWFGADTITVPPAQVPIDSYALPFETKQRWRPREDEIVRAAITVILGALVSIIAVAAAALLTMG